MRTTILAAIAAFALTSPSFAYQSGGHGHVGRHPAMVVGHCHNNYRLCGRTCIPKTRVCHTGPIGITLHPKLNPARANAKGGY
jgi:hypothetical protein